MIVHPRYLFRTYSSTTVEKLKKIKRPGLFKNVIVKPFICFSVIAAVPVSEGKVVYPKGSIELVTTIMIPIDLNSYIIPVSHLSRGKRGRFGSCMQL